MKKVIIQKLGDSELKERGILKWPIWEKEESEFPWHYDETETCYLLEGDVTVTPDGGQPVRVFRGSSRYWRPERWALRSSAARVSGRRSGCAIPRA